ncbi:MAG: ATP-binding protein [Candidatus Gastranaerophilales bacterium]|nr:ATP-binding protein [Candidatus Gastranaerophilales bacterium]
MSKTNKILILDDEPLVTSSLSALLSLEGFYDVVYFNNPQLALNHLKLERADVIISDFIMPEMNGIDFLTEAKKMYPDTSMILLTGYADKENAIKAINDVGLYKYIEKPWDNDDLIMNIKNAIERTNLVAALKDKVVELEIANKKLETYSTSLEQMVAQKTSELISANNKLNAIITNCADGIAIFGADGAIIDVNLSCENLFGLSSALLQGKHVDELFSSKEYVDYSRIIEDKNEVFLRDLEILNSINGAKVPVEVSIAHVPVGDSSEFNCYVAVVRDISSQKEMERLREDFIATLTHDLRTPLLAAIQTLQFFLDGSLGVLADKQKMLLDTMRKSNQDMLGLVNALLEVYKYEAGKLQLVKTHFVLNDLVKQCVKEVSVYAKSRGSEIKVVLDSTSDIEVLADRNEIRRVIMNLLGNAINYTLENGLIVVTTKLDKNDVIISVKDNGIGISKFDIPKLFNRFSQGTAKKRSVSTGLGLYLSKQIVEAHGGKIWVESDKDKGSEFSFLLVESVLVKDKV